MNRVIKKSGADRWKPALLWVLIMLTIAGPAAAADTFTDPQGRYAVDLPKDWKRIPNSEANIREDENVYIFKGTGSERIIIWYEEGSSDLDDLFAKAAGLFRKLGPLDAKPLGAISDMTMSGNRSRWAVYSGDIEIAGKPAIRQYGSLGAVIIGEGGLYFLAILDDASRKTWEMPMQKTFQSIRAPGKAVGAPVVTGTMIDDPTEAKPLVFTHDLLSATLPPGWKSKNLPRNFEKEAVGWFTSDRIDGSSLSLLCYRGLFMNKQKVFKASEQTVQAGMPGAVPVNAYEIEHKGEKIPIMVYRSQVAVRGQEITMSCVTAVRKTDNCVLNIISFSTPGSEKRLEKEVAEILRTAK